MADVALIAKRDRPLARENAMSGTRRYATSLEAELRRQGVNVVWGEGIGLPFGSSVPVIGPRLEAFFDSYPLGLRAPPARVLHLTMESLATGLMFARWRGPIVLTVHDVITYLTRRDPELRAYAHPLHELFDRLSLRLFRRADLLIADSAWAADAIAAHARYPRERIRVVPLGVDHDRFRASGASHPAVDAAVADANGGPVVGFVGALVRRKNLGALIRAMPAIRARVPGARLVAAGLASAPALAQAREEIAALGLTDAAALLGTVPDDAIPALLRRATVVVVPSLYEGFGLPALEAMACGTPVVAAARASLPEVVADAGILCPPDPSGIANAVSDLLLDAPRRAQLVAAGARRAKEFSWARTASLTRAVYEEAGGISAAHFRPST